MIASFLIRREGTASDSPKPDTSNWSWVAQRGSAAMSAFFRKPSAVLSLVILSVTSVWAQDVRTPITRDEVWQTINNELRHRGVSDQQLLRADEINLPVAVPALVGRSLRVSMVCWDAELARAQFQVECRQAGQCVPFLAYADAGRSTAMGSDQVHGSSCRNASHSPSHANTVHKAMVRVGERATVIFRGSAMQMTALVTCLERGAAGDLIRVRNQDGQIFRARVFAPARLEALSQSLATLGERP